MLTNSAVGPAIKVTTTNQNFVFILTTQTLYITYNIIMILNKHERVQQQHGDITVITIILEQNALRLDSD